MSKNKLQRIHDISRTNRARNLRMDGFPNILLNSGRHLKFLWFFIFLICSTVCFFLIINSIGNYLKFSVTTNYRVGSDLYPAFPMVTVCNLNPLNTVYYEQLYEAADIAHAHLLFTGPYDILVELERYMKRTTGNFFTSNQRRNLSDLEGLIISCRFDNKPCNMNQFVYYFSPLSYYLNCLRFNSGWDVDGRPVELLRSSIGTEFSMELYVGLSNTLKLRSPHRGVRLLIQNQKETSIKLTPSPLILSSGVHTKLSLVHNVYKQFNEWPYEYSTCAVSENNVLIKPIEDTFYFNIILAMNVSYAQNCCILVCYQYELAANCNCTDYWVDIKITGYSYCLGVQMECSFDFYYKVFHVGDFIQTNCLPKCPFECNLYRNEIFHSIEKYPDPFYLNTTLKRNPMLLNR